jgi:hypothetical protein
MYILSVLIIKSGQLLYDKSMWQDYPRLCEIPSEEITKERAQYIGRQLLPAYKVEGMQGVVEDLHWRMGKRFVGGSDSTIQSLLVPLRAGDFSIVVNEQWALSCEIKLRLLGHEIGHSLFYASGQPPRRIIPLSAEEEVFCDKFADYFVKVLSEANEN